MEHLESLTDSLVDELRQLGVEAFEHAGPADEEAIQAAERELGLDFPNSYRAFLRGFGSGSLDGYTIFGLPRDRIWGDVVMLNQLVPRPNPKRFLRFIEDVGDYTFCLDTAQRDDIQECPVVVFGPHVAGKIVAAHFLEFLQRVKEGLI